jgi:hypothetical protein
MYIRAQSPRVASVTITDPDEHRTDVPVDSRGRVVIGKEYSGETVNVVIETTDNE